MARFEAERRARTRLPFGLTWSSVGLATATVAAAAIFIPVALRDEIRETPASPKVTAERVAPTDGDDRAPADEHTEQVAKDEAGAVREPRRQEKKAELETPFADADAEKPAGRGKPLANGVENDRLDAVAPLNKEKQDRPAVSSVGDVFEERSKVQEAGGEAEENTLKSVASKQSTADRKRAARQISVAQEPAPAQVEALMSESKFMNRSNEAADALLEAVAGGKIAAPLTLPEGAIAAGTVEVRGPEDTQRFFANVGSESLRGYRGRPDSRLLVIGPRPGLDACAMLEVRETARQWEVLYPGSGSSTGSVSCAIVFPDDGREIHFFGERADE